MIKAVLFDFDGTIVDSEKTRFESINQVLKSYNITISKKEWKQEYKGLNTIPILEKIKNKLSLSYDSEDLYNRSKVFRDSLEQKGVPVIEGFREFYEQLEDRNIRMIICSGGTTQHVKKVLEYSNLPKIKHFGRENYKNTKPEPDVFLKGLEMLELSPEDVVIFDDSRNGILAALKTGCRVVAINYNEEDDIENLDIYLSARDYTEIDIDEILEE